MRLVGTNESGKQLLFDVMAENGGNSSAASPMEVFPIGGSVFGHGYFKHYSQKRKTVSNLRIAIEGERAEEHPHVYTHLSR